MAARRPTGYAVPIMDNILSMVPMEVARRRDVNGSKRTSVSQPSLVLSQEHLGVRGAVDEVRRIEEIAIVPVPAERVNHWPM